MVSSQSWDNTPPVNNNIVDKSEKTRRATFTSEDSYQKEDLDNQDDGWSTDELSQTEDEDEEGDIFLQAAEVISHCFLIDNNKCNLNLIPVT